MKLSLVTYNVHFNRGITAIKKIKEKLQPDIFCLQEVETTQEYLQNFDCGSYVIADISNSFIKFSRVYGLLTLYNPQTLKLLHSSSLDVPKSFYEVVVTFFRGFNNPRTVLLTQFVHRPTNKKINIYNIHFTPLFATNSTRLKQLQEVLTHLPAQLSEPVIIAGDFNYPFGRKKLEEAIADYDLIEATNNLLYTQSYYYIFRVKLDYILYRACHNVRTERLDIALSDHYPIYAEFQL